MYQADTGGLVVMCGGEDLSKGLAYGTTAGLGGRLSRTLLRSLPPTEF
jgi:hypothetical protein